MAYMPVSGRFGQGMTNPAFNRFAGDGLPSYSNYGGATDSGATPRGGARRVAPGGGGAGGIATSRYLPGKQRPWQPPPRTFGQAAPIRTVPGWLQKLRREGEGEFNYPGAPEFKPYEGKMWEAPDTDIPEAGVDTRAVVNATGAYLDERMGGEMADAARKFGSLGTLMSGGGLGSGYAGTLAESERGRDRDFAALQYQYDYDAAQQDANRRSSARENMLDRSLSSFTDYEGRGYGAWGAENAFSQWKYGTDVGKYQAEKEFDQDEYRKMFSLYGY